MVLVVAWWTAIEEGLLRSRVVNPIPKVNPFAHCSPQSAVDVGVDVIQA